MNHPILYSFRRCPYAMRARMALAYANVPIELREVLLSKKPNALLALSPKATVPVLQVNENEIIDESVDILFWALNKKDSGGWLAINDKEAANQLIERNDGQFKEHLDLYKYADRFPEFTEQKYRERGETFLKTLDAKLTQHAFLMGNQITYVDVAIFPFIRQFASVDRNWFENSQYQQLNKWLNYWLESELFKAIMVKHKPWQEGDKQIIEFS